MSRINLLLLQVLVAVVSIALWYVLTTYPIFGKLVLPPFFFSNPVDVAKQIIAWFASGVIWKHLWVTLIESILAFVIGSIGGVLVGFWFARQPRTACVAPAPTPSCAPPSPPRGAARPRAAGCS